MDADYKNRLNDHRVGQLGSAAPQRHMGRDNQVAKYVDTQSLVRGERDACASGEVDSGASRERSETRNALLGRRRAVVECRES